LGVVVLKYMYTVNCYYCMQLVMSDGHNLADSLGGTELVARGVSVGVGRFSLSCLTAADVGLLLLGSF